MEKKNTGLIVLVVVLCLLLGGFMGYFVGGKYFNKNNETIIGNDNKDSEIVSLEVLNELYNIVGILPENEEHSNNCLNSVLSVEDYQNNIKEIFSWYAYIHDLNTHHDDATMCVSKDICNISVYNAAAGRSILKSDATAIMSLYNLSNIDDFFNEISSPYENEYAYTSIGPVSGYTCNDLEIKHDISSEYIDSNSIRITDNQNIIKKEYNADETVSNKSEKNQVIIYEFAKNSNNKYYLTKVIVK